MPRLPVEVRRGALVEAAIRVIARDGVAAASTRAIVTEADMALASFHYAFASRDELLEAVIAEVTSGERLAAEARFGPPIGSDATGPAPTMESVVLAGLDAYLDLLVADPLREQALLELAMFGLRTPGVDRAVRAQYASYYAAASATLRVAADVTRSRWTVPLPAVARVLVTITDGLTTSWLADRDTEAARATSRFAAHALAALAEPLAGSSAEHLDDPTGTPLDHSLHPRTEESHHAH